MIPMGQYDIQALELFFFFFFFFFVFLGGDVSGLGYSFFSFFFFWFFVLPLSDSLTYSVLPPI